MKCIGRLKNGFTMSSWIAIDNSLALKKMLKNRRINFVMKANKSVLSFAIALTALLSVEVRSEEIVVMETPKNKVVVKTICLDGYMFAVAAHGSPRLDAGRGVSIIQIFRDSTTPVKCDK